jgi:hypothetical protein
LLSTFWILVEPIMPDTHWPDAALGANLSDIGLITGAFGILAGRLLDRDGERPISWLQPLWDPGGNACY